MGLKVSLRVRLAFWYTAIVGLSLLLFGAYTYLSVSNELNTNLDASLAKVASSLDILIEKNISLESSSKSGKSESKEKKSKEKFSLFIESEKGRFVGPLRPGLTKSEPTEEENDIVWSAIYEHILMNPKNYYIQIADTNNRIIWRSKNLQSDTLPLLTGLMEQENKIFGIFKGSDKDTSTSSNIQPPDAQLFDSIYTNIVLQSQEIRLLVKKNNQAVVSVGYAIVDVQGTMKELFSILLIAFPLVLVVSILGGLTLSKLSLRPIDEVTREADEITARNLSKRLGELPTNDEVGRLIITLNNMIERLEYSFTQIRQFTSDASHELRTPLTILQGELELALYNTKTIEEYEVVITSALEEVLRLANVVETLLELSKADAGQVKMDVKEANISKMIQDIAEDAIILAESKGIKVNSIIEPEVISYVDNNRIHQAVLNVVDNAIKYTNESGVISIELKKNKGWTEIIITDSGQGIPQEHLPHIFDRFYRVDVSRSSYIHGSGLGLSIVKWIIDAHKGEIKVNSVLNKGTTFKIRLPDKH